MWPVLLFIKDFFLRIVLATCLPFHLNKVIVLNILIHNIEQQKPLIHLISSQLNGSVSPYHAILKFSSC